MKDKEIIKKIFSYAFKNKFLYFMSILLFSCQDFAFLGYIAFIQFYAVSIIENNKMNEIVKVVGISIGLYALITVVVCIGLLLIDYVNIKIGNSLKYDMIKHILYKDSKTIEVSDVSSRLINDADSVSGFVTYQIARLLMPVTSLTGWFVIIFIINIKMGLIALISMIFPIIYNILVLPHIKKLSSRMVLLNSEYITKVSRDIRAFSTIKLFNLTDKQIGFTNGTRQEVRQNQLLKNNLFRVRTLISNISNVVATLIVMTFAVKLYNSNDITLSQIVIIPQLLSGIIDGVEGLCSFSLNMQQPIASAKRIFEIIDEEMVGNIDDGLNKGLENYGSSEDNAVEVKDLGFGYTEENMIINNLNFNINKGQIACLFGSIGCGKSTVVKLLLGFLNEKNGSVKVFNEDKKSLDEREWFKNFAFVEQEPSLFNLSIEENILLGNVNEEKNLDKMNEIFKNIGLDDMLKQLPDGIKTEVGSRGTSLSGGQRQLVCLARALYSSSPIVILDEFSSAMDENVERKVLNALEFYKKDKTFIMISHRKSCLEIADKVIKIAN